MYKSPVKGNPDPAESGRKPPEVGFPKVNPPAPSVKRACPDVPSTVGYIKPLEVRDVVMSREFRAASEPLIMTFFQLGNECLLS
tara:strand:- start:484 stop:735 length:252 start_codon:yes stop_codon:yes gene_type:complete